MSLKGHLNSLRLGQECTVAAVIAFFLASGCDHRPPSSPEPPLSQSGAPAAARSGFATISGWTYEASLTGEPPIPDAIVVAMDANGSTQTTRTRTDGFYRLSVPTGDVTITASKATYNTQASRFTLRKDTVLNFGLQPR